MDAIATPATVECPAPRAQASPAVWGPGATLLWSVLIVVVELVVYLCVLGAYMLITVGDPGDQMRAVIGELEFNGTFLSFLTFATLVVCVPVIMGIVKLKPGSKLNDYLGLKWPPLKEALRWSLIILGYCVLSDVFLLISDPPIPDFWVKAYATASPRWLLWLAVIVAAPIVEEICYRGFMFTGLAASRLRWSGATLVTAALWAGAHQQYNWVLMLFVFGGGLILGTARAKTNSTLLTIWLHILINALAVVQTAFALLQE